MASIGARIKKARKMRGLTQTDIKNSAGISSGNLSDIENDKSLPSSSALISLSRELDVSIDWILTGKEYQPKKTVNESIPAGGIELLSKFYRLSENEQLKIEGMIEGLLMAREESNQIHNNFKSTHSKSTDEHASTSETA